ncbi:MAG: 3-dehydroquinate synthase [Kiritimatiellae bacterium]|nr:3-dehydroquinate synthase [Kiritimatiellia bacterium]
MSLIFLYGPPGSGKSTIGRMLAKTLDMPFVDLDRTIEQRKGCPVREIFANEGEAAFRACERQTLLDVIAEGGNRVVSLGGGTLLNPENRQAAEAAGKILCLRANAETILSRVRRTPGTRPLASSRESTEELLRRRAEHYESFPLYVQAGVHRSIHAMVLAAEVALGTFCVVGMGRSYPVCVGSRILSNPLYLETTPHMVVVGDSHTMPLYGKAVAELLRNRGCARVSLFEFPFGEASKTVQTVGAIWNALRTGGIERGDTVVAVGGGVVGDLTGFAAATWLRGVKWIGIPTTLLSMVDSSVGGKTGADLPEGKNLVGAFHQPSLVLADTDTLSTLPEKELRCGFAEAIKHAIIADPGLLEHLPSIDDFRHNRPNVARFVARAMAVKIHIIQADPFEKGIRAALNLGHTIGHGIEKASAFRVEHGEGVAIGTVLETQAAERMGIAQKGLTDKVRAAFARVGLPVELPTGIDRATILNAMNHDKKKADGIVRFAVPERMGKVRTGVAIPPEILNQVLGA